jgi:hypothetical protein
MAIIKNNMNLSSGVSIVVREDASLSWIYNAECKAAVVWDLHGLSI